MKKIWLGAVAALAFAAPGLAHANSSGVIDLGYQNDQFEDFFAESFDAFHLGGAFQTDITPGWAVQLDGRQVYQQWDGSPATDSHSYAAVHADTSGGAWEFGGWAGLLGWYNSTGLTLGGEGRTSFGNLSLQGSLGWSSFSSYNDWSSWDAHADAAYFFSPNLALTGGFTYNSIDFDQGSGGLDQTEWSIGGAYQFANGMEAYGGYLNSDNNYGPGSYSADVWSIGLRWHFNGGSLQDYTNHGASWNGAQALSDTYMRWVD